MTMNATRLQDVYGWMRSYVREVRIILTNVITIHGVKIIVPIEKITDVGAAIKMHSVAT